MCYRRVYPVVRRLRVEAPVVALSEATALLLKWNDGDPAVREKLINHVYDELTGIAARHLSQERHKLELQPNALVHEAYLRLIDMDRVSWQDRAHFLAMAARLMRQILTDHARKRNAAKRDGGVRVTLSAVGQIQPFSASY